MAGTKYINIFRGKATYNKKWIHGDLIRGTHISHNMGATTVIPETVGMYAEAIDKHGTRVFEHDILKYTALRTVIIGMVCWKRGGFWLVADDGREEPLYKVLTIGEIEIIGNIHDNPELHPGIA